MVTSFACSVFLSTRYKNVVAGYEYYYVIFFADDFIARSTTGVGIFFTRFIK